jgi:hypothetical protein
VSSTPKVWKTIVLLFLVSLSLASWPLVSATSQWDNLTVVGDAFRIEFYGEELESLKEDYSMEFLHNTVQNWIDYRSWMRYPSEWNDTVYKLITLSHSAGVPVGTAMGWHVGDSVDAPYEADVGFLYYYQHVLDNSQKWKYPNGSIAYGT